ncbi:MAG: DNA polymerase IV [bacterium]
MERALVRAIFHVDGDAFFASCEIAKNPALRGKPVITGKERGIVSSASYEAKRLGVTRGVPLSQVRRICPQAIILSSDYETYQMYSKRMYAIARRYTPLVEEYGIDECFGDLTGLATPPEEAVRRMREDLKRELNMTFSVGLGPTKVLAKLGSKHKKPDGFTVVTPENVPELLSKTPLRRVWGIGPNIAAKLEGEGLHTALDLANMSGAWVRARFAKPVLELWQELRGESVMPLSCGADTAPHSIQVTRTFAPRQGAEYLRSALSKNIENACSKARRKKLIAGEVSFFLKTQSFRYAGTHFKLGEATAAPQEVIAAVFERFPELFREGSLYRATGVTLYGLEKAEKPQLALFSEPGAMNRFGGLYKSVDALARRFGPGTVYLGSSAAALEGKGNPQEGLFSGAYGAKRLPVPYLGEVG